MEENKVLSRYFFQRAYELCIECLKEAHPTDLGTTAANNLCAHARDVYIFSVTALEAFINETLLSEFYIPALTEVPRKIFIKTFEDFSIKEKYHLLPLFLFGKTYDKGKQPYQDFSTLVKIRNRLIHHKEGVEEPPQLSAEEARKAYNTACQMVFKLFELGSFGLRNAHHFDWVKSELRLITKDSWKEDTKDGREVISDNGTMRSVVQIHSPRLYIT
jgi:hypothetical protein